METCGWTEHNKQACKSHTTNDKVHPHFISLHFETQVKLTQVFKSRQQKWILISLVHCRRPAATPPPRHLAPFFWRTTSWNVVIPSIVVLISLGFLSCVGWSLVWFALVRQVGLLLERKKTKLVCLLPSAILFSFAVFVRVDSFVRLIFMSKNLNGLWLRCAMRCAALLCFIYFVWMLFKFLNSDKLGFLLKTTSYFYQKTNLNSCLFSKRQVYLHFALRQTESLSLMGLFVSSLRVWERMCNGTDLLVWWQVYLRCSLDFFCFL